jgi:chromate transporter
MVVTFVGYLGGHAQPVLQGDGQMLSGVLGALVATWFTFLPSFVFILAGGPMVEMTHNQWRFTVPLSGITAAVVGVMLNLAVFFAYHVGWPQGVSGPLDWGAAALTMAWLMVLFRFKWSVLNERIRTSIRCGNNTGVLHSTTNSGSKRKCISSWSTRKTKNFSINKNIITTIKSRSTT